MKTNFLTKTCIALLLGATAQFAMAFTVEDRAEIAKPKASCSIQCDGAASCEVTSEGCSCSCG
jgi:hypothetical protein